MSLTLIHTRTDRPARKHRAIDRLATCERELAELQQRLDSADELVARQYLRLAEMEGEKGELRQQLAQEREARAGIEKDRDAQERWIQLLQEQLAEVKRRLEVRSQAEAAVTLTQPMPAITRVIPLHEAPFATADPAA